MTDVVNWVLETIAEEWPAGPFPGVSEWDHTTFPEDARRINRDEPRILETGERTRSVELSQGIAIGASAGTVDDEAAGVEYSFSLEQPVSIRIEGLHEREHGTVSGDAEFRRLVGGVKEALKRQRKDPDFEPGGRYFHTLTFEGDENLSADHRDYYRRDIGIALSGTEIRND